MRVAVLLGFALMSINAMARDVWIGTATRQGGPSKGIYHLALDDSTGQLSDATLAATTRQPGFLAKHPTLDLLYSTGDENAGEGVVAWRIVREENQPPRLEKHSTRSTGDGGAAHIAVDQSGRVLFSAQYGGGSVASFPLKEDGAIGLRVSLLEHNEPSRVNADRQTSCHPHWAGATPDNRYVLVPDLGADRVYVHKLDAATGRLMPHGSVATPAGGGPRHLKFHPNGKWAYVVNEMGMSVSVLAYNSDQGELSVIQTAPTLSQEQIAGERANSGSEVRVHPSGQFVYTANRGHDSITVFKVNDTTGELSLVEVEPVRGSHPRNFAISPSGKWLLAAGRDSHTLAVFAIDPKTGELQYTLKTAHVPSPICVTFD